MEISIYNRTNQDVSAFEAWFCTIAQATQKRLQLPQDLNLSVTFVRSRAIHTINRDYRNIDRPTDVISFAMWDEKTGFEDDTDLGDIFINIDYARQQAKRYGHSYTREMCFLFTHGLLHCLGYDHQDASQEEEMFGLQREILDPLISK